MFGAALGTKLSSAKGVGKALAGIGGNLLGGLFSSKSADKQWQRQLKLQGNQHAFQERMSNTQWQRGILDMKKAGINPLLAVSQGPASSPGGGSGTAAQATPWKGLEFLGMMQMMANTKLTNAQTSLTDTRREALEPWAEIGQLVAKGIGIAKDFGQSESGGINLLDKIGSIFRGNGNSASGLDRSNKEAQLLDASIKAEDKKRGAPLQVTHFLSTLDLKGKTEEEKMQEYMTWSKERRFKAQERYHKRYGVYPFFRRGR